MIQIQNLKHQYKDRTALDNISLAVNHGEIFGLLGPNGSGKTTLFRILSTSFVPTSGSVHVDGLDLVREYAEIRKKIGIVFQSPSLDPKLKVKENLEAQGALYGLQSSALKDRCTAMMTKLGILDRAEEIVEKLSGGLKRRVELAKGLLHQPELLILDEPSTGLDPGARLDLWRYLKTLREKEGMTILVTTHLMEEAEHCDRLAVLSQGKLISVGTPEELKREIGGDVLEIKTADPAQLASDIQQKFRQSAMVVNGGVQIEHAQAHRFIPELVETFPGKITSVTFRKPTLEDVFVHKTGHRFWEEEV